MRGLIVLLVFFVVLIKQIPFFFCLARAAAWAGRFLFVESGMDEPCIGYLGQTFGVNSLKVNALDRFP